LPPRRWGNDPIAKEEVTRPAAIARAKAVTWRPIVVRRRPRKEGKVASPEAIDPAFVVAKEEAFVVAAEIVPKWGRVPEWVRVPEWGRDEVDRRNRS
jgi:hypothetical protein